MVMKDAKNMRYLQIDHKVKNIYDGADVEILPIKLAFEKYDFIRRYFTIKPKEGYFIWVKKQIDFPLFFCVSIASKNILQKLQNLLIVEKKLDIKLYGTCNAKQKNLCGVHKSKGKVILREGSSLKYEHIHSFGEQDVVAPDYEFFLEKNSKLDYCYKTLLTPKKLSMQTKFNLFENASANIKILANFAKTKAKIKDTLILKEKGASGQIQLRLVGGKNSDVLACSRVIAAAEGKGHLDCQGLLVNEDSKISLTPELVCENKKAQITHEASIGKVSEEELNYLQMRGLCEKEAVDLIVNGFLK